MVWRVEGRMGPAERGGEQNAVIFQKQKRFPADEIRPCSFSVPVTSKLLMFWYVEPTWLFAFTLRAWSTKTQSDMLPGNRPCVSPVCFLTFNMCIVAPLKATGASSVGGRPACEPAAATTLLQLMRKLMRAKVCDPSTHTTDSGLWSRDTVCPSLRLPEHVKEPCCFKVMFLFHRKS